jgi:hypothetical protein
VIGAKLAALSKVEGQLVRHLEAFKKGDTSGSHHSFTEPSDSGKRKIGQPASSRAPKRLRVDGSHGLDLDSKTGEDLEKQLESVRNDIAGTQMDLLDAFRNPKPRRDPAIAERERMAYCSLKRSEVSLCLILVSADLPLTLISSGHALA